MSHTPSTRYSLLVEIRDSSNRQAWQEFSDIYRPLVYRIARIRGLQHADAEDLAQQVLMSVAGAIERWEPDSQRGQFRTWLKRIADNAILNTLTRGKPDQASGNTSTLLRLDDEASKDGPSSDLLRIEYRRAVFRWAAQEIQGEFQPDTWDAFWLTAVEALDINKAAARLGKTRGSVYAARSRIIRRLQEKINEFDDS